jgi:hypothetical protein
MHGGTSRNQLDDRIHKIKPRAKNVNYDSQSAWKRSHDSSSIAVPIVYDLQQFTICEAGWNIEIAAEINFERQWRIESRESPPKQ